MSKINPSSADLIRMICRKLNIPHDPVCASSASRFSRAQLAKLHNIVCNLEVTSK